LGSWENREFKSIKKSGYFSLGHFIRCCVKLSSGFSSRESALEVSEFNNLQGMKMGGSCDVLKIKSRCKDKAQAPELGLQRDAIFRTLPQPTRAPIVVAEPELFIQV
jgi:hypothetical protein